jgi:hypothetical protein
MVKIGSFDFNRSVGFESLGSRNYFVILLFAMNFFKKNSCNGERMKIKNVISGANIKPIFCQTGMKTKKYN